MPTIVVPANVASCHVEIPESVKDGGVERACQRSVVIKERGGVRVEEARTGSLHIRPATSIELTDDEWRCLQAARPDLAKRLIVAKVGPSLAQLTAKGKPDKTIQPAADKAAEDKKKPK